MRILMLHQFPLWGTGSGTFVTQLSEELAKQHRVTIICPDEVNKPRGKNIKVVPVSLPFRVAFTSIPTWPDARKYHDLTEQEMYMIYRRLLRSTITAVEKFRPHIIHVQHIAPFAWVARFIKSLYGVHYIITSHGTDLLTIGEDFRYYPLGLDACRGARHITTVSPDTRHWLLDEFGDEFKKKTSVIPGGVDLDSFPEKVSVTRVKKLYKLQGKRVVLFTGKLTSLKGVKYLVEAAKNIKGEVCIIGGGPEEEALKKLAKNLRLTNIHFLGYFGKKRAKDLRDFYYAADVFVAPSVWDEPLGLVILEAMAARTPVVVTRKGGIPLTVRDNYNGFFVKARNSGDISTKVNKILSSPTLQNRLGMNARKTVEDKFSWPMIAKQFEDIYAEHAKRW